ncbi:hypothetical protein BDD12DRAFT_802554 [Trichophaea hybrida]|nr:hypothetical protein BDD12DRAFT_802554 [Trichophaea hybrida]
MSETASSPIFCIVYTRSKNSASSGGLPVSSIEISLAPDVPAESHAELLLAVLVQSKDHLQSGLFQRGWVTGKLMSPSLGTIAIDVPLLLGTRHYCTPITLIIHTIASSCIPITMAKGTVKGFANRWIYRIRVVHSVAPAKQLSCHEQQLKKQIQDNIFTPAANEGTENDEEEVKRRIYLEESSGRTYAITKTETDIIIHHVWDLGLSGVGNKRKMERLFLEWALEPGTIARRDKITTKVTNIYRTYCETKEMFGDDEQDVPALATCLSDLLDAFKNRTIA